MCRSGGYRFGLLRLILDIYSRVGKNHSENITTLLLEVNHDTTQSMYFYCRICFSVHCLFRICTAAKDDERSGQGRAVAEHPLFLAEIVAKPAYGDRVEIVQDKGPWKKVAVRGVQGWMHTSALTTKSIVLKAGTAAVPISATGSEIALAGKGFSEEIEKQYKSANRNVDYAWVDRMEKFRVTPEQMQAFLKQGNVIPAGGGAP